MSSAISPNLLGYLGVLPMAAEIIVIVFDLTIRCVTPEASRNDFENEKVRNCREEKCCSKDGCPTTHSTSPTPNLNSPPLILAHAEKRCPRSCRWGRGRDIVNVPP